MFEEFLIEFRSTMLLIYPDGVSNAKHHRDICKIYIMGYINALGSGGLNQHELEYLNILKFTTDFNWWPDKKWQWW